ncbi:MAG: acyl--CoA ligase [Rubrivivax sp.]|nr:acyl--CoA ligase [Rubrivivax sp.]
MPLLHDAFEATAARLPAKTALVCGAKRLSYGALLGRTRAIAAGLRQHGVERGDRVVLTLEPGFTYVAALHAVLRLGAVMVPLPPTTKPERLAFALEDTEATAWLGEPRGVAESAAQLRARRPGLRCAWAPDADTLDPASNDARCASAIDQDLAAILYTSGSTGRPKGVMLSHHNMRSAWASVQAYLGLEEGDTIGLALPPTFSYGLYHVLMGLGLGATVVLDRQAAFVLKVAQTLERERVTVFPAVPTLLSALLQLPALAGMDHGALRTMTSAAAALPTALVPRIAAAWPGARFFSMYGMTECKRISYLPPHELAQRPASVGRGLPHQDHWLVDADGRRLGPGNHTGELVVRGSHVMRGYWRRPDETAARLRPATDGAGRTVHGGSPVLHTGDLFRTDEAGYLHFVARMDDIIKSRGEKVAPREVEEAIHELAQVASCAVVGVPDAQLGEAVKAFVTLRPGTSLVARDIVRHCLARLENHMAPKFVEFVDVLPTTESGKVRHATLRQRPDSPRHLPPDSAPDVPPDKSSSLGAADTGRCDRVCVGPLPPLNR